MRPLPNSVQKIIIAPLNWGLGHATRCIPIIKYYLNQGKEVTIASDGDALSLLQEEFPHLETVTLPAYNVRYDGNSLFKIVFYNAFRVLFAIIKEHFSLRRLVRALNPDLVISDSRFGFFSFKKKSFIITHQLTLQSDSSVFKWFLNVINSFFLRRYDEIWVPDTSQHTLSGELSMSKRYHNIRYINPISRLEKKAVEIKYDLAIILSGPEPARTLLEESLINIFSTVEKRIILVRGTESPSNINYPSTWDVKNRITSTVINNIVLSSKNIISRSGYTSVMDYYNLQKGAILIPTPGQTEQEYLGKYLDGKFKFKYLKQENLTKEAIENLLS